MYTEALLNDWCGRKAVKKRDLLSLIGYLQHASKAVRQGRSFVRRLIDLSTVVKQFDGYVRLNISARFDIAWWHLFAEQWNGMSMLYTFQRANPHIHVISDASGTWGCGAYTCRRTVVPVPMAIGCAGLPHLGQRNDPNSDGCNGVGFSVGRRQFSSRCPTQFRSSPRQLPHAPHEMLGVCLSKV